MRTYDMEDITIQTEGQNDITEAESAQVIRLVELI